MEDFDLLLFIIITSVVTQNLRLIKLICYKCFKYVNTVFKLLSLNNFVVLVCIYNNEHFMFLSIHTSQGHTFRSPVSNIFIVFQQIVFKIY